MAIVKARRLKALVMRRRRLVLALVAVLTLVGACGGNHATFCSQFSSIDTAVGALRDAKASGDFTRVPDVIDQAANTYEAISPPAALRDDWMSVVEFFRHQASSARSLLSNGRLLETPPADDARYDLAFAHITQYAVANCQRVPGTLVP